VVVDGFFVAPAAAPGLCGEPNIRESMSPRWFLIAAFLGVLYLCFRVLQPFWMPFVLALILATLLFPLNEYLGKKWKNRKNLAAFFICMALTVVLLLPMVFLLISLAHEALGLYAAAKDPKKLEQWRAWLSTDTNPMLQKLEYWLPGSWRIRDLQLGQKLREQVEGWGIGVLAYMTAFAGGLFNFLMNYFIMLTTLFFLLRDADYFAQKLRSVSPLSEKYERMFVERFRIIARATVIGNLLTAVAQGVTGGFVFAVLGLSNPILWGTLTAFFSLVPVVGTALIWVPWALYLLAIGSTGKAILLVLLEVLAVGSIDNVLRPWLIEGKVRMHTMLVFFSIMGGLNYFGIAGLLLGPLVVAVTLTFFEIYLLEMKE
jgi:predicted PurR-regulated permease PerM